jgi:hypothetical protein
LIRALSVSKPSMLVVPTQSKSQSTLLCKMVFPLEAYSQQYLDL